MCRDPTTERFLVKGRSFEELLRDPLSGLLKISQYSNYRAAHLTLSNFSVLEEDFSCSSPSGREEGSAAISVMTSDIGFNCRLGEEGRLDDYGIRQSSTCTENQRYKV